MRGISRIRLSFDDSRLWTGCVVQGLGGDRRSGSISEWKQVVMLAGFDLSADRSGINGGKLTADEGTTAANHPKNHSPSSVCYLFPKLIKHREL